MRILLLTHIFSNFLDGGETRIVWELTQSLAKTNHEFFVVTTYRNIKNYSKLPKNLKVYQVPFCHASENFGPILMFKAFLFSLPIIFCKKIDIIHLVSQAAPCPFAVFKIRPLVVSADMPWDYNNPKFKEDLFFDRMKKIEEGGNYNVKSSLFTRLLSKCINYFNTKFNLKDTFDKRVSMYICRAESLCQKLKKEDYTSRLVYIPSGVNTNFFRPEVYPFQERDKNNIVFLFAGKISKRKGVEYLIKAFLQLNNKYNNIKLLLAGQGAPDTVAYFKKLCQDSNNIVFLGHISGDKIKYYYTYCDIFVLPSLGEPFGLVNLEAMACGKPIISTRGGAVVDYLRDGEVGFMVEPADMSSLFKAMEKFILNPNLAKEMGAKAREWVVNNYSWDKIAEKTVSAYNTLIK